MQNRYTAHLRFENNKSIKSYANDLRTLVVHSVLLLDCHKGYVLGTIRDNDTGKIVHRCKKR